MARYTEAVCKLCRREGQKLFLKSERCYSPKCGISRKSYVPGQHGKSQVRKKNSEYGLQLRAKQRTKRYYGVFEKQFRHYYELAEKIKEGKAGENLLSILESRLDNVIYRLGWGGSRAEARQLVRHGHFLVNNRKVDIPSYLAKIDDVISVSEKLKSTEKFKDLVEKSNSRPFPKWLDKTKETLEAKIISKASREEIDLEVEETLIIELYSK
ncbi:MAG: 30S ribosomal protein S4 [Candidatus Paraimprobicoccus trichonymphae]|uniref:Small ribosomal subunit protein uS4 n=1 Tax=Candidatus Paraimprobicoccus trichonymphae TaxID=3033793 RepID=A0AA48I4I2_9FIRM|nr:MAG: 30S ribosomal protein S4 [Candidatus Paraimprobicoccus trichonymphae]